jgi:hypothetical protein
MRNSRKWIDVHGTGREYIIRRALENKKQWVLEIYFFGKTYPNIITGRYKTFREAREQMGLYNINDTLSNWGIY